MLWNTLLLVAAAVSLSGPSVVLAAPTSEASPDNGSTAGTVTPLTLTKRSARRNHPDPAVRFTYSRDERLATRMKYKRFLSDAGREQLERDIEKRDEDNLVEKGDSIPLVGWGRDWEYTASIEIGTPPQKFEVQIDTGSRDLWVWNTCTGSSDCSGLPLYNSTLSRSFQPSSTDYNINYSTGSVWGMWGFDAVSVGGYTLLGYPFGLVNRTMDNPAVANVSGVMGFGRRGSTTTSRVGAFWESIAKHWREPAFSMYLQRDTSTLYAGGQDKSTTWGSMLLGGTDRTLYQGDINYVPMDTEDLGFWQIPIQGISVGDKAIKSNITVDTSGGPVSSQPFAIIDSGTALMYGPPDTVAEIYDTIPGSIKAKAGADYVFPCDTFPRIGLAITFGGISYRVDDTDMIFDVWTARQLIDYGVITSSQAGDTERWCEGSLRPQEIDSNLAPWLLGDSFMKNIYTVFRYDPPAVGLAKLAPAADKKVDHSLLFARSMGA